MAMHSINIPHGASEILNDLHAIGHEAYIVGGCVRDSLLGVEPKDWDICTSASPQTVEAVFQGHGGYRVFETGLKHGTVSILSDGAVYEVTTFRKDGNYSDGRRPDDVEFVSDVIEDLARRDFTINAMAYSPEAGLIDPYCGLRDLQIGVISCVGSPDERFAEDGLRLLRALRFASTYGFKIDGETSESIHRNISLLENISAERINSELCKILCGNGVLQILLEYKDVVCKILPELEPCVGFDQNNRFHQYTVYDHIAHAVANYPGKDVVIKLALLLHDVGKPQCYTEDENGGHFHGHAPVSAEIADFALFRLRFDNQTRHDVVELIGMHDATLVPTKRVVRRILNKIGPEQFTRLIEVRFADINAHAEGTQSERLTQVRGAELLGREIIAQNECFTVKDMAINGNDVMALGVPEGRRVGEILAACLTAVMNDDVQNEHSALIEFAKNKNGWGDQA